MLAGKIIESSGKSVELKERAGLFECLLEHKVTETKATFDWKGPKISRQVWGEILAYFKWTYDREKSESQVRLFVHPELGWMAWAFPQKGGTGMTTKEIEGEDFNKQRAEMIPPGYLAFGTVHHHCSCGAFQSGVDKWDEEKVDGLHITVGNIDKAQHDLNCRLYMKGSKFEPDMSVFWQIGEDNVPHLLWMQGLNYSVTNMMNDIARREMGVAPPPETTFPEKWKENYIVPAPATHVTYGMQHQQQSGQFHGSWQGNGGAKGETNGAANSSVDLNGSGKKGSVESTSGLDTKPRDDKETDAVRALNDIMQFGWMNAITESRCRTCIEDCRNDINSELKHEIMALCEMHHVDIDDVYVEMLMREKGEQEDIIDQVNAENPARKQEDPNWVGDMVD